MNEIEQRPGEKPEEIEEKPEVTMFEKARIKAWLKKIFRFSFFSNGYFAVYVPIPLLLDSRLIFALRHARQAVEPRKVVFDNYMGKGYGCNPKYVAEKLERLYPGKFELVWIVTKEDSLWGEIPDYIRKVNYGSPQALKEYATAKLWVSNYHKISFLKRGLFKRKGQYFIQMWHGSLGIKKIENDVSCLTQNKGWLKLAKRSSDMVDFWISNSGFEKNVYQTAFWNVGDNVLMYGHPRNDILFSDMSTIITKVQDYFGIRDREKKIVFYAPTFRENYRLDCYQIDFERLQETLHTKFGGEWVVLVRLHPRVRKYSRVILPPRQGFYDATYYTDIQELVAAADCMITDYSSCIFDFVLTKRPGFIFAADIEEYNTERGFYYPLETTPFSIAKNNDELIENILRFNVEEYCKKVEKFLQDKDCVEDGHASERVAELIECIIEGNE